MLRDFFLGFVKIHILHHAAQEPIYGLAMIDELRRHGYEVSPGTIYPVLHTLEAGGYLSREERVIGGEGGEDLAITKAWPGGIVGGRRKKAQMTAEREGGDWPAE